MTVFPATVLWPGKEFSSEKFGDRVSATFLPPGVGDKDKEKHIRVNAKPGTPKAKLLLSLKRGQQVYLAKAGETKDNKPYFDVVIFKPGGLSPDGSPNGAAEESGSALEQNAKLLGQCWVVVEDELRSIGLQPNEETIQKLATTLYLTQM